MQGRGEREKERERKTWQVLEEEKLFTIPLGEKTGDMTKLKPVDTTKTRK